MHRILSRLPYLMYPRLPRGVVAGVQKALRRLDAHLGSNHLATRMLDDMHLDPELLEEYNAYVISNLSGLEPINLASVVTRRYVFDFLIYYFSIADLRVTSSTASWAC